MLVTDIQIAHSTVVCLVPWPLFGSEAGADLVLIQTSLLFICKYKLVSIRTAWSTYKKQVCVKTKPPPALLPVKDHVTKYTTVKWVIESRMQMQVPAV